MRSPDSPNAILVSQLKAFPTVKVQNNLMRMADRPIALAMMYMEDPDRNFVFSHLPVAKVERIEDELRLQRRLKITYDQYKRAVESVLDAVGRDRAGDSLKSYIRPKRK